MPRVRPLAVSDEYIKREAAYNAIVNNYTTDEQLRDLDAIPPENVVTRDCYDRLLAENDELRKERPVVRCEECTFYEVVDYGDEYTKNVCRLLSRQFQNDDYCSYGIQKDCAE